MSIIAISITSGLIIDMFLRLIKYKHWNTIVKIIILSLITFTSIIGLKHIYNNKLKNPRYAKLYRDSRKGFEQIFGYLNANVKSNDIIIGSELVWTLSKAHRRSMTIHNSEIQQTS